MPYDQARDVWSATEKLSDQSDRVVAVVPSDSTDFTAYPKALYVGVAGDVKCIPVHNADAAPVVFTAHPVGYMAVRVRRVYATGTTATNLLVLY